MLYSTLTVAADNLSQTDYITNELSKELEDSLIEAEKEGILIRYYTQKEAQLRNKGNYEEIINISNWIEKRLPKNDIINLSLICELRAPAYSAIGDYDAMFADIEKSLSLPKDDGLSFRDAMLYLWIMDFHLMFNRENLGHVYLNKARDIALRNRNSKINKDSWKNLNFLIHIAQGQFYRRQNQWDSAKEEYNLAEKDALIHNNKKRHLTGLSVQKFYLYFDKGEYKVADSIYETHLRNNKHIPFMSIGNIQLKHIDLLLKMGNVAHAKNELEKIHPDSIHTLDRPALFKLLSDVYKISRNYSLAYDYLQKYTYFKDSLENEYRRAYASQATDRFEMRQVEKDLDQQRRDNIRNWTLIMSLLFILIGVAVLVIIIIRRYKKRKYEQALTENNLGNRNAALSSATIVVDNYKNICQNIKDILNSDESATKKLTDISAKIKESSNSIEPLHHINNSNEKSMQEFMDKLRYVHPDLTNTEIRMAQLVFMNISNKDIAELQKRSIGTIKNQKYSLRKKLGTDLPTEVYLKQLSAASPSELEELAKSSKKEELK